MTHYSPIRPPLAGARMPLRFDDGRFHRWRLEQRIILDRTAEAMVCALRFTPPEADLPQWKAGAMAEITYLSPPARGRSRERSCQGKGKWAGDLVPITLPIAGGIVVAPHVAAALLPSGFAWRAPPRPTIRLPIASIATDGALDLILVHRPAQQSPAVATVMRHLLGSGDADLRIADTATPRTTDPALTIACDIDGLATLRAILRDRAVRGLPTPAIATTVDPVLLDRALGEDLPPRRVARIRTTDAQAACVDIAHHLAARIDDGTPVLIAGAAAGLITPVESLLRARFGDTAFDAMLAGGLWRRYPAEGQAVAG
ncbi:hypothetical protein [Sphingomonas sanxanigenens]|uniref:FAD-binding FR-type domain-containing protein n=1 Tax=Sphingomonas sanxanigenens DSM 19645 = NX02 TaxID=1123269 RepID=W0AJ21_9SPHN|nr:hypothetical protein [Sphingomonas sanxanigenens]AHE57121.1 hypothetical protein NX02_27690 [Sphingomonas sanxanigenens DSM 19645 = NX02]